MLGAPLGEPVEEGLRCRDEASFADDRLDDQRSGVGRIELGVEETIEPAQRP